MIERYQIVDKKMQALCAAACDAKGLSGIFSLAGGEHGRMEILKSWSFCYRHGYIRICFGIAAIIFLTHRVRILF